MEKYLYVPPKLMRSTLLFEIASNIFNIWLNRKDLY